ncbi:MAG: hypothetical protein SGI73_21010 [Chloroflexota bacterium]|nr:hypothetical protein [Chloroflexota bacterium]
MPPGRFHRPIQFAPPYNRSVPLKPSGNGLDSAAREWIGTAALIDG